MPDVCSKCQKLIDISNSQKCEYIDDVEMITYHDDILNRTDESIKILIKNHNNIIDHFEKCNHKGCKELMENWKPYHRYTDRMSILQ